MSPITYKDAGVDLDLYQQAMHKIPGFLARTHNSRVIDLPGGFAGLFRLNEESRKYNDPVLVSGSDGVGTKIKVAAQAGRCDTIGIDLVAMCVNDCQCLGAEPLFFLDYIALGKDDPQLVVDLVQGVSDGCLQAKAALLGGETAIMPDLYAPGDFDMAGFCVGVVERDAIVDGSAIQSGDVLIGLASSGFHSNGYSLIRKAVFERARLHTDSEIPELNHRTVGEVLLEPTRIYTDIVNRLTNDTDIRSGLHGMAHITGGGLAENVERVLPENRVVSIDRSAWTVPPVFNWLDQLGNIGDDEMFRVFNMGIGFVLIVDPEVLDIVRDVITKIEIESWVIGQVTDGTKTVGFSNIS